MIIVASIAVILFTILCLLGMILHFGFKYYLNVNDNINKVISTFEVYLAILTFHMEKSYEIIYKEKVLPYSLESIKLDIPEQQRISKDFASLTLKMIGKNVKDCLVSVYGDEETLIFNIMQFFTEKMEKDEIYKSARDNLVFGEEDKDFIEKLFSDSTANRGNMTTNIRGL
jgi:hypothetical protein